MQRTQPQLELSDATVLPFPAPPRVAVRHDAQFPIRIDFTRLPDLKRRHFFVRELRHLSRVPLHPTVQKNYFLVREVHV